MNCKICKGPTVVYDEEGNPISTLNDGERWHSCIQCKSWCLECIDCKDLCTFIGYDPCFWICDGCKKKYKLNDK